VTQRQKLKLHFYPDQILRNVAKHIHNYDADLQWIANQMFLFLKGVEGIGLAAPQVGVLYRIVVVDVEGVEKCLVNPEILSSSEEKYTEAEGCLSILYRFYAVQRSSKIEIQASSPQGKSLHFKAQGLAARVLQHEIDHLHGILICDHGVEINKSYRRFINSG
jgi:peptide deformylase